MAEFLPKNLGNGKLSGSKTTLYTVPSGKNAIIQNVSLVNTHTAEVVMNLWVNFGPGSIHIVPKDLRLPPGGQFVGVLNVALAPSNLIEGQASVASVADFIVSGVEAS